MVFSHKLPTDPWLRDKFDKYQAARRFRVPPAQTFDEMSAEDLDVMQIIDSVVNEYEEHLMEMEKHKMKGKKRR